MYSVVHANPAYVLLAALDLLSGCEIRNSSGTFVSSPNFCQFTQLLSVFPTYYTLGCTKEPRGFWGLVAVAFTHVGAECVGGPWDFEGFLFFLMHLTIHPYSKLRKALSCGTIHNHFVSSATGQNNQNNQISSSVVQCAPQCRR